MSPTAGPLEAEQAPRPEPSGLSASRLRVLPFLRRRLWIGVLFAVAAAAIAAGATSSASATFSASGYLVVPANGQTNLGQPDNASGAQGLAETYAVLLPNDPAFTGALFARSHRTSADSQAVANLSLTSVGRTSVIRVSTSSTSRQATLNLFADLTAITNQNPPVSTNIIPGTLRVLQEPEGVSEGKNYHKAAPIIAALLGAVFGIFLGLVLERARPRFDHADDVAAITGLPAFDLRRSGRTASLILQARLPREDGPEPVDHIVIVGVGRSARQSAQRAAEMVRSALTSLLASLPGDRTGRDVHIVATGDPTLDVNAVWIAQDAGESWLSVPVGVRADAVLATLALLSRCNVQPTYAVVSSRRLHWPAWRRSTSAGGPRGGILASTDTTGDRVSTGNVRPTTDASAASGSQTRGPARRRR